MSHTKEPWSINDWPQPDTSIAIGAVGTPLIARVILRDVSINGQKANAARIVACVNACAGIATEELEWIASTGGMLGPREDIKGLAQQRDKLLAALKVLKRDVEAVRTNLDDGIELEPAMLQAQRAIDETEGNDAQV